MIYNPITAVGIDVSKAKSTVAIRRPGGEVVMLPFDVQHNMEDIQQLISTLRKVAGDIKIVMEHTGMYWRPIALTLMNAGFFVSIVNAMLIHDFSDNSIRKVKTDKADSMKIASYALTFWAELRPYTSEDETRNMLKIQCRHYDRTLNTSIALRNGLIALLDQCFPGVNHVFGSEMRTKSGHLKWIDFSRRFWHKDCVATVSLNSFADSFQKWCKRTGYHFSYASLLPEYEVVMAMQGAGPITGPQLMAEIGDVRRFTHKGALVAFAGMDAPPFQSGTFDSKSRQISKRGSPHLRQVLFNVCSTILQHSNPDNPVFQFMDKKRSEGKHYYVYMVAGGAKFLRIYYARVKEALDAQDAADAAVA